MNQRRLYRTIESFASEQFKTEKDLLKHVINEIVKSEDLRLKGGRLWQYEPSAESYRVIHQIGQIDKLDVGYRIQVASEKGDCQVLGDGNWRSVALSR
jgi:hypothetical protein